MELQRIALPSPLSTSTPSAPLEAIVLPCSRFCAPPDAPDQYPVYIAAGDDIAGPGRRSSDGVEGATDEYTVAGVA